MQIECPNCQAQLEWDDAVTADAPPKAKVAWFIKRCACQAFVSVELEREGDRFRIVEVAAVILVRESDVAKWMAAASRN